MSFLEQLRLLHPGWRDLLEIAIVSVAIYRGLLLIQRTRAMHVLAGIVVLAGAYGVAYVLQLSMIVYLLQLLFGYSVIALLVVFAPELRAALAQNEHLGHLPELVRTRLGWARALLARGQVARAHGLIAAARGSANELGMAPAQAAAERLGASAERCA